MLQDAPDVRQKTKLEQFHLRDVQFLPENVVVTVVVIVAVHLSRSTFVGTTALAHAQQTHCTVISNICAEYIYIEIYRNIYVILPLP